MRHWTRVYEERNPRVTVKNESASWGDLSTKVQTYVAAGTMADVAFQHGALMLPERAAKGVWLDLEAQGNAEKHDWSQYFKWALDSLPVEALIEGHGGASLLATSQVTQKDAPPWPSTADRRAAVSRLLGKRTR